MALHLLTLSQIVKELLYIYSTSSDAIFTFQSINIYPIIAAAVI